MIKTDAVHNAEIGKVVLIKKDNQFSKGSIQKKNVYKAVRLTAWVDPPSPSPEAVRKIFRQVVIFGVILPFYKG